MAGLVFSAQRRLDKAGLALSPDTPVEVRGRDHPWVSRGGIKLAAALDAFAIDPGGLIGLDVGASTGGFTDVLLSRGAERVYAVDVGSGQLAWKLRSDFRVVVLERINARMLSRVEVPELVDLVVCDVSFISLTLALPAALVLSAPDARLVTLIKPQFEAGREQVGKGGIVRDAAVRHAVCDKITAWLDAQPGWRVEGLIQSPISGADGNIEYLLAGRRTSSDDAEENQAGGDPPWGG